MDLDIRNNVDSRKCVVEGGTEGVISGRWVQKALNVQ